MIINDRVYGSIKITQPLILELIQSPSLQRLKGIDSAGYPDPFFTSSSRTRFEHSVGVFYLLRKYNASLEEQIAGLIHDVSHTALSHITDYVFDEGSTAHQNYQDDIFQKYVRKSELSTLISRHGYNLEKIIDANNFPLLETELPDLCADRIDYSLREGMIFKKITLVETRVFLKHLKSNDNHWFFDNTRIAQHFADIYRECNKDFWTGLKTAIMFVSVGEYIKHALKENYISKSDLYTTDQLLLDKVAGHHNADKKLRLLFDRMNNRIPYFNDPTNYETSIEIKSRIIDPLCMQNGDLKRLSEINPDWGQVIATELKPQKYFIRFEK